MNDQIPDDTADKQKQNIDNDPLTIQFVHFIMHIFRVDHNMLHPSEIIERLFDLNICFICQILLFSHADIFRILVIHDVSVFRGEINGDIVPIGTILQSALL